MMKNLMTIEQAIKNFKNLIYSSIRDGGNEGKTAMIRSSLPILNIHEAVKSSLVSYGVSKKLIYPSVGERSPELKLAGALKQKDQDVCVVPNHIEEKEETLKNGLLEGTVDKYGEVFTEQTLVINIRSQISSIQKNFDTLYERTISEAQNLHDRCSKICLGEVYMIAIPEFDDKAFAKHKIEFKTISQRTVEKYIKSFSAINLRTSTSKDFYKYERACLLIVDFSKKTPKLYKSTYQLIKDGFLPEDTKVRIENLTFDSFISDLMSVYETRFGTGRFS